MTTIAYKDGVIACDSRTSFGGLTFAGASQQKVFKTKGGYLGTAGDANQRDKEWALPVKDKETFLIFLEHMAELEFDIQALFVADKNKNQVLYGYTNKEEGAGDFEFGTCVFDLEEGHGYAIGSGQLAASVAMYCGCTAEQAVEVAAKFDTRTDDRVKTYEL